MVENVIEQTCSLSSSDWISIISLIINSLLAIWIVITIQKKLRNRRVLKDHIINEILDIRLSYKRQVEKIHSSKAKPKELLPWFKLMNVKVINLMDIANSKYGIDKQIFDPFQTQLRFIITEDQGYINSFKNNQEVELTDHTKQILLKFLQENNYRFNSAIVSINDA